MAGTDLSRSQCWSKISCIPNHSFIQHLFLLEFLEAGIWEAVAGKAVGNMIAGEGKNRGETPSLERLDQEALPHPTVDCTKVSVLLLFVFCLPTYYDRDEAMKAE